MQTTTGNELEKQAPQKHDNEPITTQMKSGNHVTDHKHRIIMKLAIQQRGVLHIRNTYTNQMKTHIKQQILKNT